MSFLLPSSPEYLGNERGRPPAFAARPDAAKRRPSAQALRELAGRGAARLLRVTPGRQVAAVLGLGAYAQACRQAKANLKLYVDEVMLQAGGGDRQPFLPSRAKNPALFYRDEAWRRVEEAVNARGDSSGVATRFTAMLERALQQALPRYGKNLTRAEYRRQYAEAFCCAHPDDAPQFTLAIRRHCLRAARPRAPAEVAGELASAAAIAGTRRTAPAALRLGCHVVIEVCGLTVLALLW